MKNALRIIGKVLGGILSVIAAVLVIHTACTIAANFILEHEIQSYEPVAYENQLVPEIGTDGYYTITADRDIKIMQLNDLHIGGGLYTLKKDKKTVYEVMTMVQQEKPDLVILNGDSVFAVPDVLFRGGGTLNNKMVSKQVARIFESLHCYYTIAFGNHDTEAFDYTNREKLGEMYMDPQYKYCIFNSDFDGYGVTNQCILLKDSGGNLTKTIFVIDSNDYIDDSIASSINWRYDTIHDEQIQWVENTVSSLSMRYNTDVKGLFFFHIPIGEFETAYRELEANNFASTENVRYIEGVWDEEVSSDIGGRIWYGGCCQTDKDPKDVDNFFERLGPDGIDVLEACFFGHDHVNNAVVTYRGVMLGYGYALDNTAYKGIEGYGLQRGAMVITVRPDGTWNQVHKNAYKDYGCETDKFIPVRLDKQFYDGYAPAN